MAIPGFDLSGQIMDPEAFKLGLLTWDKKTEIQLGHSVSTEEILCFSQVNMYPDYHAAETFSKGIGANAIADSKAGFRGFKHCRDTNANVIPLILPSDVQSTIDEVAETAVE